MIEKIIKSLSSFPTVGASELIYKRSTVVVVLLLLQATALSSGSCRLIEQEPVSSQPVPWLIQSYFLRYETVFCLANVSA